MARIRRVEALIEEWTINAGVPIPWVRGEHPSEEGVTQKVRDGLHALFAELERLGVADSPDLVIHADGRGRHRRFLLCRPGENYGMGEKVEGLVRRLRPIERIDGVEGVFAVLPKHNAYRFSWAKGPAHRRR